jgi:thiamine kinase
MDPADIAAETLGTHRGAVSAPEPLKHGLTNESWLVRTAGAAVVVRLSHRDPAALQIDRRSEAVVLRVVAEAGLGAPVLRCDPARQVLVTQYLPGHAWSLDEARAPANVARLAGLLRRLHALPAPPGVRSLDLHASIARSWDALAAHGATARAGSPRIRARARRLVAQLAAEARTCLCHNDVHHLNVLDSGSRLWLVDWEYAGRGDPDFDLAGVCCYHAFDAAARRELLAAYRGEVDAAALGRLERMCWVFDYVRDLWFAVREL